MDLITLSAAAAAAQTAAEAAGGGGGPTPPPAIPERTDEHYANTVLLLHGDGNPGANNVNNPAPIAQYMALSDDSPNDRQVSTVGTNVYGTDFNPFYYNNGSFSNSFDGTASGAITITPTDDRTDLSGTVSFTIQFWIFPRSVGQSSNSEVFSRGRGSQYAGYRVIIPPGASTIGLALNYAGTGASVYKVSSTSLPLNEWSYVAITREANTLKIYINGVLDVTETGFTGNPTMNSADVVYLGRGSFNTSNRQFDGLLNSFELIKGRNLYSANFTPPTAPTEDPTTHGELSVYFDGVGDYLTIPSSADFNLSGDFTIEFWLYKTESTTAGQYDGILYRSTDWRFKFQQSDTSIYYDNGTDAQLINYTGGSLLNSWHHIAFVRSGSTLTGYVDGTSYGSVTESGAFTATADLLIGRNGTDDLGGYISNLRIVNGTALYTGAFTPSSSPLTTTSQSATSSEVKLLTCQGKTFQDYSDSNHSIARSGNAHITEFGPFGDGYWSNDFSGDAELVQAASSSDFQLGSSEFTIEGWFYPTTTGDSGYYCIIGQQTHSGGLGWGIWRNGPDGYIQIWLDAGATKVGGAVALGNGEVNVWNHFVAQRDSSDYISFYLNGTRTGYSVDATHSDSSSILGIGLASTTTGWNSSYKFDGYISNIRITKGSALYSGTSITVPTAPYTTTSQGASASEVKLLTCQSNRFIDNSDSAHSLTLTNSPGISEKIPFEYLQRQTKLITCQENRFKDIINYRWLLTPSSGAKVSTSSPFSSNASYKTANTGAIYMDGTSFVTVDNQGDSLRFGTEDWTIEFWVYVNESGTAQSTLIGRNGTGVVNFPYIYRVATSRVVYLYYGGNMAGTTKALLPFEWTHIAYCRENGTSRVFMNGELQGSGADTTNLTDPVKMTIGNNGGASSLQALNGYIYGVRVEKGRAKYTSNASFNPAATAPVLANSANTGAISTNQFSTYWPEDTSADYLANTNPMPISDYAFGINDWTIEGWINLQDTSSTNIVDTRRAAAQGVYPMIWMDASNTLEFWRSSAGRISSRVLSVGKWYHFAFVRSGGTTKLYLNGLKEGVDYADAGDYLFDRLRIGYNTNNTYVYKGWIHGLNMLNGVAKYTSNTAITYSPVSRVGTQSANNHSVYFDNARFISVPSSTDFDYGTGDFTIEAWIHPTSFVAAAGIIGSFNDPGSGYRFVLDTDGKLRFNNDSTTVQTATGLIKLNNWYHVALTKSSSYINIYINGMRVTYASNSQTIDRHSGSSVVTIGKNSINNSTWYFNGYISNVRVVKGTALYTGNSFVPATEPFTTTSQGATASEVKLLTCQANTIIDHSNSDHAPTADNGFAPISTFSPFDNGYWSTFFSSGNGPYLQVGGTNETAFDVGSGDFTMEAWIKFNSTASADAGAHVIFSKWNNQNNDKQYLFRVGSGNGSTLQLLWTYDGSTNQTLNGSTTVSPNEWYHVALVNNSGTLTFYIDGTADATTGSITQALHTSTIQTLIGAVWNLGAIDQSFDGHISNFRFANTAVYTSDFTPSTSPLTRDNNTLILACQSGAHIDNSRANSGIGFTVQPLGSGSVVISRSRPFSTELARDQVLLACQDVDPIKDNSHLDTKFTKTGDVTRSADNPFDDGFWSGSFDGDGDYLSTPNISIGTQAYTLECFVFITSGAQTYQGIFSAGATNASSIQFQLSNELMRLSSYTAQILIADAGDEVPLNTWTHLAFVRDSSNVLRFFKDGVLIKSGTDSTNWSETSADMVVGRIFNSSTHDFEGFISNLHFVVGTAKYTASFSKPTVPITPDVNTKLLTCQSSNFADNSNTLTKITASGNANTRPVFPFANTIPQQTTFLTGKFPGSIRNKGFLDESSNNTPLVVVGTATQGSFTPHYPASGYWSNYFDGNGDGLTTATSSDFAFGTGDFTFECFAFPTTSTASGTKVLLDLRDANNNDTDHMSAIVWTGSAMDCYSGGSFSSGTDLSFPQNQWTHLCVQRISNVLYFSTNGTVSSTTPAFTRNLTASGLATIGGNVGLGSSMFTGYISNLRIIKGTGIYGTSSFTSPTGPLTTTSQGATASEVKLLTCQSNRFVDSSSTGHTITAAGDSKVQPFFPFDLTTSYDAYEHGGSGYFVGGSVRADTFGSTIIGSRNFDVEFWFYPIDSAANQYIFNLSYNNTSFGPILIYMTGTNLRLYSSNNGSSWNILNYISMGTIVLNQWNHIYLSRVGSSGYAFVNGTASGSNPFTWSTNFTLSTPIYISSYDATPSLPARGYISNLRYNIGQGNTSVTIPTSQNRPVSNTVLHCNFTNAGIYDSTAKNVISLVNDARVSTGAANTKFGTGSVSLDGSDYFTLPLNNNLVMGTGDFTWEMFFKYGLPGYNDAYLIDQRNTTTQVALAVYIQGSTDTVQFYVSGAARITSAVLPQTENWHHFALVKYNNSTKIYINGNQTGAAYSDTNDYIVPGVTYFGTRFSLTAYFPGQMDEIRVTKGFARYTANFTPMTAASGNKSPG